VHFPFRDGWVLNLTFFAPQALPAPKHLATTEIYLNLSPEHVFQEFNGKRVI
jgi:hypothetical protein